jgi:hypothetical protein
MSKLNAVHYRLFEGEQIAAECSAMGETHDFGGEVVLTFGDGRQAFVSWVNDPVQHSVGSSRASHFVPDADLLEFDVSASAMWADVVGYDVSLDYDAPDNQVLKVASAVGHVLLCSYEQGNWRADEITICKRMPGTRDS